MNILFLSRWCPCPQDNGAKIRVNNVIRSLAKQHRLSLVSFYNPQERLDRDALAALPVASTTLVPYREYDSRSAKSLLALFGTTPRSIVDTFSAEMAAAIRDSVKSERFDLVVASELWTAAYHECFSGLPAILDDIESACFLNRATSHPSLLREMRAQLTWKKYKRYLSRLLTHFGACTVPSQVEHELLHNIAPSYPHATIIPNGIRLPNYLGQTVERAQNRIIFCGALTFAPNYNAARWFITDVLPVIKNHLPGVELEIIGSTGGHSFTGIEGVIQTGWVPDIRPYVGSATVCIAPIFTGGGTRLKILEAMALRTPVVATRVAAEGIDVTDGQDLLLADTAPEFAEAVIRVLTKPVLQQRLGDAGFELVKSKYDWDVIEAALLATVAGVGSPSIADPVLTAAF